MTTPNLPAEEVGFVLPNQSSSPIVESRVLAVVATTMGCTPSNPIVEGDESHMLVVGATTMGRTPSSLIEAFNTSPREPSNASPQEPSGNLMTAADNGQPTLLTLGIMAPPHSLKTVQVSQAPSPSSGKSTTSLKRIDQSESEDELSHNDVDMTLMTSNDSKSRVLVLLSGCYIILTFELVEARLQQQLFKARFNKVPPPKKGWFDHVLIIKLY
jgi:hypothetical protein